MSVINDLVHALEEFVRFNTNHYDLDRRWLAHYIREEMQPMARRLWRGDNAAHHPERRLINEFRLKEIDALMKNHQEEIRKLAEEAHKLVHGASGEKQDDNLPTRDDYPR